MSAAPAVTAEDQASPAAASSGHRPPPTRESLLRRHLLGRVPTDRLWGWLGPLLVTALAGVLRFWRLDQPHQLVFDETYYVKQAYTYLKVGYELRWPNPSDESFTAGTPDIYLNTADFPVHPPVGKWMIAVGEWLFGIDSSWGWRFSAALCGTLMVLMTARIARRLFSSTLLGVTAGLLLAVEGHHFVHSRTSLLDIFLAFWVLAAFGALLVDRDRSRTLLARRVARSQAPRPIEDAVTHVSQLGPALGVRPWRLVAAVCLGLAVGTKWSGLYFVAAFGLMTVLWDMGARRAVGVPSWFRGSVLKDGVPATLTMLPIVLVVYVASWGGWFASKDAHLRQWGEQHPSSTWVPDAFRSFWKYHQDMWAFHVGLSSPHPYSANPWSWLVQGRPTSFFYEGPKLGEMGCKVESCSKAITSLGNVVIWWGGTAALAVLVFCWLLRRDWRAGAVLAGVAAGYLPWFMYQHRTIYAFYSVAFVAFIVLGLTYVLGLILGPRKAPPRRRVIGAVAAGSVVVLAVLCFAYFWPIYSAEVIPYAQWHARMWFPSWI
ncbi:MAG TPA: phospholipid carrier-dependent glycosyltransferase [Actinomycetales bacterium]|nr:phospholipid carrier-dependent glycosyltransferase [Actinomycetales bacterium]